MGRRGIRRALIERADAALYRAKAGGRDRTVAGAIGSAGP